MKRRIGATVVAVVALSAPARAARDVSILDLVELDIGYTTISDQYYRRVSPQALLDGARNGMVAYLRERGIADPQVGFGHARPDGRGAVPAIEHELGTIIVRYGARVDVRELVFATIRGELGALHDPYSVFFTKSELHAFTTALDGQSFGGIGIVLAADSANQYHVDQVFDHGPASRAGMRPGDTIVGIDEKPVAGLSSAAISALLRGKIGTVVRVRVAREGTPLDEPLTLTRAAVRPPDVTARMLPGQVGYVALRVFGPSAGDDVHAAVRRLETQGARALVFDLRGDGGGYERAAVNVASAFVQAGPIVAIQENHGKRRVTRADGTALPARPLVVLVDHDSASGSELVTAAIRDHAAGTIVGVTTFGKGLVQTLFPLPDGSAMKLTTARYFTPNGRDIDRVGITPDVIVQQPPDATTGVPGHDPQLDAALTLLGSTPPNAANVSPATPL